MSFSSQGQIHPTKSSNPILSSTRVLNEKDEPMFLLRSPEGKNEFTIVKVVGLMKYIQYLSVQFPSRLQAVVKSRGRNFLSLRFGGDMPSELQENFSENPLPPAFLNRYLSSSFLVNFWEDITTLLVIFVLIIVLVIINKIFDLFMLEKLRHLTKMLLIIAKWNLLIIVCCTMIGDAIIYSALELQTFYKSSQADLTFVSFSSSVIAIGITLLFVGFIAYLIKKVYNLNIVVYNGKWNALDEYKGVMKQWEGCRVLFGGFNDHISHNQFFFLIYLFRLNLPLIFSLLLQDFPISNTTLQLSFNLGIILYVLILQPLKKKINHIQILLFESMVFIMNILILIMILHSIDRAPREDFDDNAFINVLGDIVIIGNDLINSLIIVFLVIKLILEIQALKKHLKKHPHKSRILWVQLISLPIQQSGFGFEEMIYETELNYPTINNSKSKRKIYPQDLGDKQVLKEVELLAQKDESISQRSATSRAELFPKPTAKPNQSVIDLAWKSQTRVGSLKTSSLANTREKQGTIDLMDISQESPLFKNNTKLSNVSFVNKHGSSPQVSLNSRAYQKNQETRTQSTKKMLDEKREDKLRKEHENSVQGFRIDRLHALKKNNLLK